MPREWGARGPVGWPLPRRSFSAAARAECPVARDWSTQPRLPPTGPAGSGRGQPLRGLLLAHLPRTPVLCPSQSQQPTLGPQTVLCTDTLRPAPPSRVPGEACGDWGLQPGQGSESGNYTRVRGHQGNRRGGQVWGVPGGGARLVPHLCAVSGEGPPSQPSPEPRDAPKVTAGGGGAGFSAWSRSAAPPTAGVDGPLLPSTEASPAPRAQANTGRGGVGGRRGAGLARQHVPRVCDSCQGTATSADEPAPPSLTRAGPMRRAQGLAPAVSRMHGALAAWAEP